MAERVLSPQEEIVLRATITEKAARGGTIAAKNAARLLATLDTRAGAVRDDEPASQVSTEGAGLRTAILNELGAAYEARKWAFDDLTAVAETMADALEPIEAVAAAAVGSWMPQDHLKGRDDCESCVENARKQLVALETAGWTLTRAEAVRDDEPVGRPLPSVENMIAALDHAGVTMHYDGTEWGDTAKRQAAEYVLSFLAALPRDATPEVPDAG